MELTTNSIIANLFNLVVLAWLLWWLGKKPIMDAIHARQQRIANAILDTEVQLKKVAEQLAEQRRLLDEAKAESERIATQARTKSEELKVEMAEATRAEVAALRVRSQKEIQQETEKAIYEIRREAAHQAVKQAERLLAERLRVEQTQEQLLKAFARDVPGQLERP
ncbi:MAG: ATP synthase F0 subunit B [Nevskia sp.]|nr:ATP synthase F0 subunit B [Nevskia sp.]